MRAIGMVLGNLALGGIAFAATKVQESPGIVSQILSGFDQIIAGSTGLKIAVAIVLVIGFAVGYWKGSSGGF